MTAAAVLRFIDETPTGRALQTTEVPLRLASETVSVRELLRRRIEHEVAAFNAAPRDVFRGLVQPTDAERVLNGYRVRTPRALDPAEQLAKACEAFERGGFLLLVGDGQVESLDERVLLAPDVEVRFVKLVPLVGG
jgi:hypothetical protein